MASTSANDVGFLELSLESMKLHISYLLTGNFNDLQQAVRCAEEAFGRMPPDCPQMPLVRFNVARPLVRRFLHTRQVEDITKAIEMFEHAFRSWTDENKQYCYEYLNVSRVLRDSNLEGSVETNDLLVCSPSMPESKIKIMTLFRNLREDYEVYNYCTEEMKTEKFQLSPQSSLKELDSAIQLCQQAVKFFSPPPSIPHGKPLVISLFPFALGDFWLKRYTLQGLRIDNDRAVDYFSHALKLPMPSSMFRVCQGRASEAFICRFEAMGRQEDLDNAVNHAKGAVKNCDSQDADSAIFSDVLARSMLGKFRASGELRDLDAAISAARRAVDIAERHLNDLPRLLGNFAVILEARFTRTGETKDLKLAIDIGQRGADLMPPEDPRRVQFFVNLSKAEMRLGDKLQDIEHQYRAFRHLENAWGCLRGKDPESNPGLNFYLHSLSAIQLFRMKRLDEAIQVSRIFDTNPDYASHPKRGEFCINLCECLFTKWKESDPKERKYLDEAIDTARRMIKLAEAEVDELICARKFLGNCLRHRHESTRETRDDKELTEARDDQDLTEALAILEEGFQMSAGSTSYRIMTGQAAIDILLELAKQDESEEFAWWGRARKLSQEIVDLIVLLNGRSLEWTDKQFWMHLFSRQVPTYASIALQAGSDVSDVIDMLETCRGQILGHLIDNRIDLDELKRVSPKDAERFNTLADEVNSPIKTSGNVDARVEENTRKIKAEAGFRVCLENIRRLEGFHRFLLGPTQSELKAAAVQGPILMVNVTSIRSDAIIITEDVSIHLSLPELTYEKVAKFQEAVPTNFRDLTLVRQGNKKYLSQLRWLWDNCVELIFEKLDKLIPGTAKFHVWWIGIGMASSLPFHAAGIYTPNVELCKTALSRAISSYTPTLKILIHGRRKLKNDRPKTAIQGLPSKPKLLVVTMPSTPGNHDLKGVQNEAAKIQEIVGKDYSAHLSVQPSAEDTMKRMEKYEVVHFACHGTSNLTDPSSSHILLQTTIPNSAKLKVDELNVRDVAALNLTHGKLAFLSACSTAENADGTLQNEALHLAAGFHVAGYLHSVGNLWPANDTVSVDIVERFYQDLVEAGELGDGQNVARALNRALVDVIKNRWRQPLAWAQFVHIGV